MTILCVHSTLRLTTYRLQKLFTKCTNEKRIIFLRTFIKIFVQSDNFDVRSKQQHFYYFENSSKFVKTKARTCHCLTNAFGTVRTICNLLLTVYFDLKVWRISSLFSFSAKFLSFQKSKFKFSSFNSTLK